MHKFATDKAAAMVHNVAQIVNDVRPKLVAVCSQTALKARLLGEALMFQSWG